jgi:hypothetical protein
MRVLEVNGLLDSAPFRAPDSISRGLPAGDFYREGSKNSKDLEGRRDEGEGIDPMAPSNFFESLRVLRFLEVKVDCKMALA